ncbi:Arylsulfatase A [Tenacibaculum sp. 190524A02b]|uniref:Arylsulfatase A n=1 Tax=Tenacibaculum vairaonense TaxID=3137860 RepID=A0ABM9PRZ2_9FLAO
MRFPKLSFLVIILLVFVSCSNEEQIQQEEQIRTVSLIDKPNILLVIADDMGLDATPSYSVGTTKPNMPNLQNLITNGLRFSNVWSNPTCTPTRAGILTGKYGFRTNVMKVDDELSISEVSIQQYLKNNNTGYSTAVIGKWHLSKNVTHPNQMGIDYYAGLLSGSVQSYSEWNLTQNESTITSREYITTKFTDLAIDWVKQQSQPWFLWLAYNTPHTPFHLPPEGMHSQGNLPADQASVDANPLPYYMGMIEAMDFQIGRLLNSMSTEEKENTIIIFIGDNGTPGGVVQEYRPRKAKGTLYQGGVNVPMVISGKNVWRKNEIEEGLVNTTDLFATIAEIAGVNTTTINDSKSFKEYLSSNKSSIRDFAYTEQKNEEGVEHTIRNKTHKYIQFANGSEALFDLVNDAFEQSNLLNTTLDNSDAEELESLKQSINNLK